MNHGEPEDKDSWGGGAYAKYFGSVFFIDAFDFSDSGELEFADPGAVHIGWYKVPDASRLMVRDFFPVLGEPADLYRNGEDGVYDESWNFSYGVLEQGDVRFELHIIADGTNRNSRVTMIELRVAQDDPDVDAADGDDEGEGDPGDEDSQAVPVNEFEDLPDEQP